MNKLEKPEFGVVDVFNACIDSVQDNSLKKLLSDCSQEVINDESLYEELASTTSLYTFPKKDTVNNAVNKSDMIKIYDYRMVGGTGRSYYDTIFQAPKQGICPSCGEREVETLDHVLPKKNYPTLVVTPINLVPSCNKCNKKKSAKIALSSYDEPIHPYYDDIQTERWLYSRINRDSGIFVNYYVVEPENWDEVMIKRVKNHFAFFELGKLFSLRAALELSEKKYRLCKLHKDAGPETVKRYLEDFVEDYSSFYNNNWKKSLYECLAADDWFCNEGIYLID
ncbi:HNH endonuclease [Paenibacillus sp. BJ-4]|uniref:HNH endonuclease n=1 Tax=Paenibacillus sp. BJ-4 TaxID=2878097 RepID=UPI001CF0AFAE|nr:HNH endonuclease signature motif containing protein [Paenibacillus sp. BJ-4]